MELEKVIDELKTEVRQFNEEAVKPLQERLASLEERGTGASDEKVADLEKQLCEAETRSTEKLEELQEQVRLAQARDGLLPAATDKTENVFKGAFINDIDELERSFLGSETRAINVAAVSGGGKMTAEQATSFLDYVVGDQPTLGVIEKRMMSGPTADLDRIAVGSRKLIAATEADNAALDTNGISFSTRTLTTSEAIWAEDISLTFLEDNIAGGNAEQQIANVVAKAIGEELNDLAWSGDSATGTFLAINSGFETLAFADGDVLDVDQTSNTDALAALNALYSGMPSQYRALSGQTIFASPGFATAYMDVLGDRATALGDATLSGGASGLRYFGVPIVVDRHLDADKIYMTPRDNLVFGVQRDVTSETEWNPRRRRIELTVSIRFDFEYKFGGVISRGHTLAAGLE
jgi:hypothetical protein